MNTSPSSRPTAPSVIVQISPGLVGPIQGLRADWALEPLCDQRRSRGTQVHKEVAAMRLRQVPRQRLARTGKYHPLPLARPSFPGHRHDASAPGSTAKLQAHGIVQARPNDARTQF